MTINTGHKDKYKKLLFESGTLPVLSRTFKRELIKTTMTRMIKRYIKSGRISNLGAS